MAFKAVFSKTVGNAARANPRLFAAPLEPVFAHRHAPPLPSFDHLVQPHHELVTLLTYRVRSMLGPLLQPEWTARAAPKPVLVATTEPEFAQSALDACERERRWEWGNGGAGDGGNTGNGKMQNWSPMREKYHWLRYLSPRLEIEAAQSGRPDWYSALRIGFLTSCGGPLTYDFLRHSPWRSWVGLDKPSNDHRPHRTTIDELELLVRPRQVQVITLISRYPSLDENWATKVDEFSSSLDYAAVSVPYEIDTHSQLQGAITMISTVVSNAAAAIASLLPKWR